MTRSLATLSALVLLLTTTTDALSPASQQRRVQKGGRRALLQGLGGAVVGAAVTLGTAAVGPADAAVAQTGASSPWTGFYDDPNHAGCLRQVKVVGAPRRPDGTPAPFPLVEVRGYDGPQGSDVCTEPPARRDAVWTVKGPLRNEKAVLDFSSKGGPADLVAKYEDGGIVFPDGNKWTKVPGGTPERLPKDMSTLKSN